jgi:hypothetical protein
MSTDYINKQKERVERIKKGIRGSVKHPKSVLDGNTNYYWVYGYTPSGKKVTLGAYSNPAEADRRATKLNEAEIFELPTRDRGRAVQLIRAKLLQRGQNVDKAIERQLGEKGYAQEQKRFGRLFRR